MEQEKIIIQIKKKNHTSKSLTIHNITNNPEDIQKLLQFIFTRIQQTKDQGEVTITLNTT